MRKPLIKLGGLLIIAALLISACSSKPIDAQKMAEILVNYTFFDKDESAFNANVENASEEGKRLKEQVRIVLEASVVEESPSGNEAQMNAAVIKKLQAVTEVKIAEVKELDGNKIITYDIKGLDFANVMKTYMEQVIALTKENPALAQSQEVPEEVYQIFLDVLANAKAKDTAVQVDITLAQTEERWSTAVVSNEQMENLAYAMLSGTANRDNFEQAMSEVINEVMKLVKDK